MNGKTFYITTPIYYPSENAHVGHGYCTVATDAIARYKRMQGFDVMFLTGTDEHGQKIETKAKEAGVTPKEYVDRIVAGFKSLWQLLNISNDRFIRTTDDYHKQSVQRIFKDLYDRGDIYKGKYEGWYCTPCESFWTETQLAEGACPDCHREVKRAEEEAYFFRLSKYGDRLLELYRDQPDFIQPESRKNEMINFIGQGLEDLCVSRTSFSWGVPVDFDPGHVVYVWVDALSNYITALGYGNDRYDDYGKYWPADVHFVGKEIVRFHTIIWPAMLMALELPLPKQVYGHGWLLIGGDKMSKSRGNVVDPAMLCERYGVDAVRYFLLREVPFGQDGNFTNEALITRINADLANDLGNLVSRTAAMVEKYFGGALPADRQAEPLDDELSALATALRDKCDKAMEGYQFSVALAEIWTLVGRANKYIDETMPWVLGKDESKKSRLATVLYNLCEVLRVVAILVAPFLPATARAIGQQIGAEQQTLTYDAAASWGLLSPTARITKGGAMFPRIDVEKELQELEAIDAARKAAAAPAQQEPKPAPAAQKPEGVASLIDIAEFGKVELKVAKITGCEPVPKADKLLRLVLDDGSGTPRQVVSGIHLWYKPEELLGKKVAVVANLRPAKLRGVESQGMILAADVGDRAKVLFVDDEVPCGAKIR